MSLEEWYRKTERQEERALRRKLRRDRINDVAGGILTLVLAGALFWLCLAATPSQSSVINDLDAAAEAALSDAEVCK